MLLLAAACSHSGDDGRSGLRIALDLTSPSAGVMDVTWLEDGGGAGGILVMEILARDISSPFDGFDLELTFDPLIATAQSVSSGNLLEICSAGSVLKADNVANGNANISGTILISEALTGASPPGCTFGGTRTLARVTFRAAGRGSSPTGFVPYNGNPNVPAGSRFYRRATSVPEVPVTFFDGSAVLNVTHQ